MLPENGFRIGVALSDVSEAELLDMEKIDLLFAGHPFCYIRDKNPLKDTDLLEKYLDKMGSHIDKVVLSLPICPMESDSGHVNNILNSISGRNIHGVEVHSPGMAMKVRREYPGLKIYFGSFANIYTDLCAKTMEEMRVTEGTFPFELSLDEIEYIKNNTGICTWLPVFGEFPISFSQYCYFHRDQHSYPYKCNYECERGLIVEFDDGKKIIHRGRSMNSCNSLNMLEYMDLLLEKGFNNFRIEGLFLPTSSINDVVTIFRDVILSYLQHNSGKPGLKDAMEKLKEFAPGGFCNGFYFTGTGMEYIQREAGI